MVPPMDLGLEGTAAIVGGASSGIGLAVATALAAEGCGVTMLARTPDRLEHAAAGVANAIAVNSIAPGKIDTPRVQEVWRHTPDPDAARERDLAAIPARRLGSPAEIGAAVAFLCSQHAGYISGTVLPVDGGALRGIW